jgi:hypothetical protein
MAGLWEHFRDGGWGMFPTLVFGLFLLGVAARYALAPRPRDVPLLISLAVLTFVSGGLGFVTGIMTTFHFVAEGGLKGDAATAITLQGVSESLNDLGFALVLITLATMGAALGAWKLSRLSPEPDAAR